MLPAEGSVLSALVGKMFPEAVDLPAHMHHRGSLSPGSNLAVGVALALRCSAVGLALGRFGAAGSEELPWMAHAWVPMPGAVVVTDAWTLARGAWCCIAARRSTASRTAPKASHGTRIESTTSWGATASGGADSGGRTIDRQSARGEPGIDGGGNEQSRSEHVQADQDLGQFKDVLDGTNKALT